MIGYQHVVTAQRICIVLSQTSSGFLCWRRLMPSNHQHLFLFFSTLISLYIFKALRWIQFSEIWNSWTSIARPHRCRCAICSTIIATSFRFRSPIDNLSCHQWKCKCWSILLNVHVTYREKSNFQEKGTRRRRFGLLPEHPYSITGLARVRTSTNSSNASQSSGSSQDTNLIRLQSPWAGGEYGGVWGGAWSERSWEWNALSERDRDLLASRTQEDGEFWMSVQEFLARFVVIWLAHIGENFSIWWSININFTFQVQKTGLSNQHYTREPLGALLKQFVNGVPASMPVDLINVLRRQQQTLNFELEFPRVITRKRTSS